jgi:hypothetical protein
VADEPAQTSQCPGFDAGEAPHPADERRVLVYPRAARGIVLGVLISLLIWAGLIALAIFIFSSLH